MKQFFLTSIIAAALLAGCAGSPAQITPTTGSSRFRSEACHLEVDLPAGWGASEGTESLTPHLDGLVAFNSWGQAGFWARQLETQTPSGLSFSFSPEIVLGQIPEGGAYVVLVEVAGGPELPAEDYGPERTSQDLQDLWTVSDCREAGYFYADFFKWGRQLRLEVFCDASANETITGEVNQLVGSWRFDRVPASDIGWATVVARELLPPEVDPRVFPIIKGGPTESTIQKRDILWSTRADILPDDVVAVTYILSWNLPESGPVAEDCPPESCHWWRIEARPDGEFILVEEGGAALPVE